MMMKMFMKKYLKHIVLATLFVVCAVTTIWAINYDKSTTPLNNEITSGVTGNINVPIKTMKDGVIATSSTFNNKQYGDTIEVVAPTEEGYVFLYWLDGARNKILSYQSTYNYRILSATPDLRAVYLDQTKARVVFLDANENQIAVLEPTNTGGILSIVEPNLSLIPVRPGYEITGWSQTLSNLIVDENGVAYVKPIFSKTNLNSYDVFVDGTLHGTYEFDTIVNLEAELTRGLDTFRYWEENGNIVSYDRFFSFTVHYEKSLLAVYGEPVTKLPMVSIDNHPYVNNFLSNQQVTYVGRYNLPNNFTLVEVGIIVYIGNDTNNITLETENIIKITSSKQNNFGEFTITQLGVSQFMNVVSRSYLTYEEDGEIKIEYSDNQVVIDRNYLTVEESISQPNTTIVETIGTVSAIFDTFVVIEDATGIGISLYEISNLPDNLNIGDVIVINGVRATVNLAPAINVTTGSKTGLTSTVSTPILVSESVTDWRNNLTNDDFGKKFTFSNVEVVWITASGTRYIYILGSGSTKAIAIHRAVMTTYANETFDNIAVGDFISFTAVFYSINTDTVSGNTIARLVIDNQMSESVIIDSDQRNANSIKTWLLNQNIEGTYVVNDNISLPSEHPTIDGTISWSSSNQSIVSNNGNAIDVGSVTLTATITVGATSTQQDFIIVVQEDTSVPVESVLYSTGFENSTPKTGYALGELTSDGKDWILYGALRGNLADDKKVGSFSIRGGVNMTSSPGDGYAQTKFTVMNITKIDFQFARYGTGTAGRLSVEVSKDQSSWIQVFAPTAGEANLKQESISIDYDSVVFVNNSITAETPIYIRFVFSGTTTGNTTRMNLDEIKLWGFTNP